jgi:long-chain fatty acid transport protein
MRYVATDSRVDMVDVTPAIAYQIHPMVSIGGGVDYVDLFNATLNRQVNVTAINSQLPGFTGALSPDGSSSVSGQGTAWGYHGGLTFQPNKQNAFGITYHSKEVIQILGSLQLTGMSGTMAALFVGSSYSTSAYTDLVLPQNIQLGYAYKPNDKWTLEADTAWYDWAQDRDLNVRYAGVNNNQQNILTNYGQGNPTSLSPRDAWSFATGANYKVTERWQVRGGFWYEPSALPDATFNPAYMDLSRYALAIGTGYGITDNLSVDVAYNAIFMHNRTINNNVQSSTTGISDGANVFGASTNGTYSDFANLVALNFIYRFGAK